ncbi:U11/U12 small nuclear ribonucleoprotein 25 kDa protein isoform X2 [Manihot esculenta]|nr:U11/U12 small nuclear ribonucleoprotein 25 kDa protein isoform X2 [Manihot esculenta]XP_021616993.1 U11/U12 small nuclear ribonucleoprotein 25 kDa protein isoform X2 [Manihot esculenta]KAG8652037.1 hypothetical protein MANES_06G048100v8 [Manihot esculenta]KAG8652038.1 hypothetical protein MANES_06G048100v8 [Manihot esculenta]KAG8652039.1 hypothetical protein MANES_06G048100v8 [Manihot esculenta]
MSILCRSFSTFTSFAYGRLPQNHFRLSILRLNGSYFEVEVSMMASVGELKKAVEDVFSYSTEDDNSHHNISWSHVWSQFCLCYGDQKLVDDNTYIRSLGIKDGDQLYFIRDLTITNCTEANRQAKEQYDGCGQYSMIAND